MKENKNNQPVDDLFARRLGNASLTPSPDGFERLQARMSKSGTETRKVLWRNPAMQRYMAVAASLLLVCLFGWLYNHNEANNSSLPAGKQVAGANTETRRPDAQEAAREKASPIADEGVDRTEVATRATKAQNGGEDMDNRASQDETVTDRPVKKKDQQFPATVSSEQTALAQAPTTAVKNKTPEPVLVTATVPKPENTERLSENTNKTAVAAERVLTVTIEEPATLVAARLAAKEKSRLAVNEEKNDKEPKSNLWQQVRRIKDGEVFARHDNTNSDDRGLLGRAYSGLKQSFEKDKPEKQ